MTTSLITGVAGQDGALLSRRLLARGDRVVGIHLGQPLAPGVAELLADVELVTADITDADSLADVFGRTRPDVVFNLAGISSVARSWEDPVGTFRVNADAVLSLLHLIHGEQAGGRSVRLVQASSAEIFGRPDRSPQDETTPLRPVSPYGLSKAAAHQAVGMFREAYGLHASCAILYNHESTLRPEAFVTRKITRAAAAISLGLQESLELGAIDVARDWGHADDYMDALVRMSEADAPGDYVVATGVLHTLRDLLDVAFAAAGIDDWTPFVRTSDAFRRPQEIAALVGDPGRARELLGWVPRTTFEQLITDMALHDLALLRDRAGIDLR